MPREDKLVKSVIFSQISGPLSEPSSRQLGRSLVAHSISARSNLQWGASSQLLQENCSSGGAAFHLFTIVTRATLDFRERDEV